MTERIPVDNEVIVVVPQNAHLSQVVKILNNDGIFKPGWLFSPLARIYAQFNGKKFYSGTYRFTSENTNFQVLKSLFTGSQLSVVRVTFPEGLNLREYAGILSKKLKIDSIQFLRIAGSDSILKMYDIPGRNIEGYLMPATYEFFWKENPGNVIKKLLDQQNLVWNKNFAEEAQKKGKSRHEILTLASIIEAETPVDSERKRVSGLYTNRLRLGMKFEADPTVQYAIGEKRKLSYKDLESGNRYNTYKFPGLPPGPINSPGKASIEAALNPEKHNYLFFVAVGDGSGRHNFSTNYNQHQKFKRQFKNNQKLTKK